MAAVVTAPVDLGRALRLEGKATAVEPGSFHADDRLILGARHGLRLAARLTGGPPVHDAAATPALIFTTFSPLSRNTAA
ncbi:MAG: hypothetical protein ACRD15_23145 [Vicinamibacterales bacterium]